MSTSLKVKAQTGRRPSLEFRPITELQLDPSYQRSIENGASQALVRKIAINWDWSLCQPLAVARRSDETLYVIDGQHRLAAARERGDIYDLPCVIMPSQSPESEAASFVALNQQRRPLSALDLFRAGLVGGDKEVALIQGCIDAAGLRLAPHNNPNRWKPGQISNVAGLRRSLTKHGSSTVRAALIVVSSAFGGQVLRYAGTIWPGVVACVASMPKTTRDDGCELLAEILGAASQDEWRNDIVAELAAVPHSGMREAAERAIARAWAEATEE